MRNLRPVIVTILCLSFILIGAGAAYSSTLPALITVAPEQDTQTILANPLMGFQDHMLPQNYWPSSTGYIRASANCYKNGSLTSCGPLNWDRLNPARGVYDFTDLDAFVSSMASQKRFVVFRVRNATDPAGTPFIPQWAKDAGVTFSFGQEPFGGGGGNEIDYHRCEFLDAWDDLVNELVRRYDGNPTVSAIDIGSYGFYGEWFSGKTVLQRSLSYQVIDPTDPTQAQSQDTRTRIVRMFTGGSGTGRCVNRSGQEQLVSYSYTGFRNKPVLISRGDPEDVQIGVANGAGIRFDGVGAADNKQNSFRNAVASYVASTWRTRPIMGEFGGSGYTPTDANLPVRSLCFAREFHVSAIHNNFNTKPAVDMSSLFRELGYRIVLNYATYPNSAAAGSSIALNLTWSNQGTSPAYQRYPLYLYLKVPGTDTVVATIPMNNTDIRQILPADVTATSTDFLTCPKAAPASYSITETVTIPTSVTNGTYDVYFGFQEPAYQQMIQLGLKNKDVAGRYLLGQIAIQGTASSTTAAPSPTKTTMATATVAPSATPTRIASATPTKTSMPTQVASATPTKTSTPVQIASPTPTKTSVPTLLPTATSVTGTGTSQLTLKYMALATASTTDDINMSFQLLNTGTTAVNLSTVKIRYYFTQDAVKTLVAKCYYASNGCTNISAALVKLATPLTNADYYMEIGFNGGTLNAGAKIDEVQMGLHRSDWTTLTQTNDYSFNASATSYQVWNKVSLLVNNVQVFGVLPSSTTTTSTTANLTSLSADSGTSVVTLALPTNEAESASIAKVGTWAAQNTASASAGSYLYANDPNASLNFQVEGPDFDVIYVQHAALGTFGIEVDKVTVQTVTETSATTAFQVRAAVRGLSVGSHTVRIYPISGVVAIDAIAAQLGVLPVVLAPTATQFIATTTPLPQPTTANVAPTTVSSLPTATAIGASPVVPATEEPAATDNTTNNAGALTTVESNNQKVVRTGTWSGKRDDRASGGRYLFNKDGIAGDSLTFQFSGNTLNVIYVLRPNYGMFAVEIDGVLMQTVSANAEQATFGQVASFTGLSNGAHTVRIYSANGVVGIDAFQFGSLGTAGAVVSQSILPTPTPIGADFVPTPIGNVSVPAVTTVLYSDNFDVQGTWMITGAWRQEPGVTGLGWAVDATQRANHTLENLLPISLVGAVNPVLTFWQRSILSSSDAVIVEVTVDNGATWQVISQQNPNTSDWQQQQISLAPYAGMAIRLRIRVDATNPDMGSTPVIGAWFDDMVITNG